MCPCSLLEGSMCKCTVPSCGIPVSLVIILPAGPFNVISETICCAKYVPIGSWFAEDGFSELKCYILSIQAPKLTFTLLVYWANSLNEDARVDA